MKLDLDAMPNNDFLYFLARTLKPRPEFLHSEKHTPFTLARITLRKIISSVPQNNRAYLKLKLFFYWPTTFEHYV